MSKISSSTFPEFIVKGSVFSIFGQLGPEAIFGYPIPSDLNLLEVNPSFITKEFSQRNYMQVAIKSIALLLNDYSLDNKAQDQLENIELYGVLPYPDLKIIGFTYFTYFFSPITNQYSPVSLTLFIPERYRGFIYDSLPRLKGPTREFTRTLIELVKKLKINSEMDASSHYSQVIPLFVDFFAELNSIQHKPISPVTKHRRIKIIFTGLENTGKTSFLVSIKRNYSFLPSLVPTTRPTQDSLDFLGTTILKWDIPGSPANRTEFLEKAEFYIYETDLMYYFIDVQNPKLSENEEFLKTIISRCDEFDPHLPIVFILTKVDEDVTQKDIILQNLAQIKARITNLLGKHPYKFFHTSIFSIYSVLNAFSYGLRQLSPNRPLLEHLLHDFIKQHDISTALLLNENGLVLASVEQKHSISGEHIAIQQIFEIAAPQFTTIAQQFSQIHPDLKDQISKYQFSSTDYVIMYKFHVDEFKFFLLFYSKNSALEQILKENFETLRNKIHNLLVLYIK